MPDVEAEIAALRDRIERQVREYVDMVEQLERLTRIVTKRFIPEVYHDA